MKYALTGPRGAIFQILDTAPVGQDYTEITNDQAAEAAAIRADKDIPFLINGEVTSRKLQRDAGNQMRWNNETNQFDITSIPIPVPQLITAWQAQAALKLTQHGAGTLYDAVVAALAAMPDGAPKIVAQTAFDKDAKFDRSSPTIASIATALSLTSEHVDALFILGYSLEV